MLFFGNIDRPLSEDELINIKKIVDEKNKNTENYLQKIIDHEVKNVKQENKSLTKEIINQEITKLKKETVSKRTLYLTLFISVFTSVFISVCLTSLGWYFTMLSNIKDNAINITANKNSIQTLKTTTTNQILTLTTTTNKGIHHDTTKSLTNPNKK